jgi:hypothetical protein
MITRENWKVFADSFPCPPRTRPPTKQVQENARYITNSSRNQGSAVSNNALLLLLLEKYININDRNLGMN